ncbi:TetR family transcriptional regulator C-terminal domain-containing protein [Streptomyces sp. NPDC014724]|uniref:TetR family transcriptional regulator C-terminal domain-containing protein n=1 Tax=unclassified Streptomyces TaxID=2593676 RepID=UPI0036F60002
MSSWDLALADEEVGTAQADRYTRIRAAVRAHLEDARHLEEVAAATDPEQLAAETVAFVHGLTVQALFDPGRFPAAVQTSMIDDFLRRTATTQGA